VRRTAIIDECELLTTEAQNALLKITEEPPLSSLLVLATNDLDALLPTISSRLQKIYFGIVTEKEIVAWLTGERGIVKKIAEGTPLDKMPFKENVEIRLNSIESTILPYKYALIKNKPLISKELIKYLKEH